MSEAAHAPEPPAAPQLKQPSHSGPDRGEAQAKASEYREKTHEARKEAEENAKGGKGVAPPRESAKPSVPAAPQVKAPAKGADVKPAGKPLPAKDAVPAGQL